jgi:hypothetical protein
VGHAVRRHPGRRHAERLEAVLRQGAMLAGYAMLASCAVLTGRAGLAERPRRRKAVLLRALARQT